MKMITRERKGTTAEYYTPRQISEKLGVHLETVYEWIANAGIPVLRVKGGHYRIPVSGFREWEKRNIYGND
jgi:excisionase family DNA binding protein